jgi:hypothetical protein
MSRVFDQTQTGANQESIIAPPSPVYNSMAAFTLAAWVFIPLSGGSTNGAVIIKDPDNQQAPELICVSLVGSPTELVLEGQADDNNFAFSISNELVPLNEWVHLACTFDVNSADKFVHLYINGVECTYNPEFHFSGALPIQDDSDEGYYFGGAGTSEQIPFEGSIAEVAIWNAQLSSSDIANLAASTGGAAGIRSANLVGYWHLCGLASPEPDSSGNGNSGVLSSNPPLPGVASPGYSGCSGGNTYDPTKPFIGSVRVLGSAPAGEANDFIGTMRVIGSPPAGEENPYLGSVTVGTPSSGDPNPALGQVVIVSSVPTGADDEYLGQIEES